ncbi:MAG: DNA-deoxyinosine glycosylase [Sphingomonadaceae bacterium]|nr:DNA-deoxyinosine glycosylase [Sphingomonadaceae bacterium]
MSLSKRCFAPVVNARTCVLVLGSLPGEASLAAARYYAHPQNQFWRLVGGVLSLDLASLAYEARLPALLAHGVGLWDTVGEALRAGSLDGAIRDARANDLAALVATLPELRAIAFNGKTAARVGRSVFGETGLTLIDLPSSSPALTTPFAAKARAWQALAEFASSPRC